tara:strand:- start:32 stop:436 length:405 start_codon:yes stop_codon:yes gene_type:complete
MLWPEHSTDLSPLHPVAMSQSSGIDKSSSLENEAFLAPSQQRDRAFARLKSATDKRRVYRINKVASQQGEGIIRTISRIFFLSACVIFDGLVLTEIIVMLDKTIFAWITFAIVLSLTVFLQSRAYSAWFDNDAT